MQILRYLATRAAYTLLVIWLVVSVVFLLVHLVPGDPILQMLGEGAPPADIAATRHAYGLALGVRKGRKLEDPAAAAPQRATVAAPQPERPTM